MKGGKRTTFVVASAALLAVVLAVALLRDVLVEAWFVSRLSSSDAGVRQSALEWLSENGSERAIPDAVRLLAREPTEENYTAVWRLCSAHLERLPAIARAIPGEPEAFSRWRPPFGEPLLYRALARDHFALAELLIALGADVKSPNSRGWTLLHSAASDGDPEALRFLLANGARPSTHSASGETPLHAAARWGREEALHLLIAAGADVNEVSHGWTPLQLAAYRGFAPACEVLLESGANPDGRPASMLLGSPLHWAANHGYEKVVDLLVKHGADVHASDSRGDTPLHSAVAHFCIDYAEMMSGTDRSELRLDNGDNGASVPYREGHKQIMERLIAAGADVNARNERGRTALHELGSSGRRGFAKLLIQGGADLEATDNDGQTPLHVAAGSGRSFSGEVAGDLVAAGARVEARDHAGKSPAELAAERGLVREVRMLTAHGATLRLQPAAAVGDLSRVKELLGGGEDVNARDDDGRTALHRAACHGQLAVVRFLAEKGAKLEARDRDGDSPLDLAVKRNQREVVERLTLHGADVNARGAGGKTPLHHAALVRGTELAALLLAHGASVTERSDTGWTALHFSAETGFVKHVRLFLAHGARTDARSNDGKTPADLASYRGWTEIVELLARGK